jgi:ecdysteroid kinase
MDDCIATIEEATPAWLTEILLRKGNLARGRVQAVAVRRIHTEQLYSVGYFLDVEYSSNSSTNAPIRLFLKLPKRDAKPDLEFLKNTTEREISFYQIATSISQSLPIIPCYDAAYNADRQIYHLLLDDLSETHDQPSWHLTIADHYITQTVDSLAAFHAYWWEHSDLGGKIGKLPTPTSLSEEIARLDQVFLRFVDELKDQLSQEDQRVYELVLAALPSLWAKRSELHNQTLIHGDPHFWNFFYPLDPERHQTYMLDWQPYRISPGTRDLAHTIVLRYPHRTLANEQIFVKRYYEGLLAHGVAGYSWEQCWYDYRCSAAEQLLVTLDWLGWASNSRYVRRALAAFQDLACDELLPR